MNFIWQGYQVWTLTYPQKIQSIIVVSFKISNEINEKSIFIDLQENIIVSLDDIADELQIDSMKDVTLIKKIRKYIFIVNENFGPYPSLIFELIYE